MFDGRVPSRVADPKQQHYRLSPQGGDQPTPNPGVSAPDGDHDAPFSFQTGDAVACAAVSTTPTGSSCRQAPVKSSQDIVYADVMVVNRTDRLKCGDFTIKELTRNKK